jgi:hypothetical protein
LVKFTTISRYFFEKSQFFLILGDIFVVSQFCRVLEGGWGMASASPNIGHLAVRRSPAAGERASRMLSVADFKSGVPRKKRCALQGLT